MCCTTCEVSFPREDLIDHTFRNMIQAVDEQGTAIYKETQSMTDSPTDVLTRRNKALRDMAAKQVRREILARLLLLLLCLKEPGMTPAKFFDSQSKGGVACMRRFAKQVAKYDDATILKLLSCVHDQVRMHFHNHTLAIAIDETPLANETLKDMLISSAALINKVPPFYLSNMELC